LVEDGLLIQLVVQRVSEEVAAGHEVSRARDGTVADNSNLRRTCRRCSQRHKAGAVAVDRDRVVGGQRLQSSVLVDRNVGLGQDLKGEVVRAYTCRAGVNNATANV
jgi:hypothetical protein